MSCHGKVLGGAPTLTLLPVSADAKPGCRGNPQKNKPRKMPPTGNDERHRCSDQERESNGRHGHRCHLVCFLGSVQHQQDCKAPPRNCRQMPGKPESPLGEDVAAQEMGQTGATKETNENVLLPESGMSRSNCHCQGCPE